MRIMRLAGYLLLSSWLLLSFPLTSQAGKEPLLDNNLDLKTNRLNQKQTQDGDGQNFTVDDRLFNEVELDRLTRAEKLQEEQAVQEQEEWFVKELPKAKDDLESMNLFTENHALTVTAQEDDALQTTAKPASFFPLISSAVLITIVLIGLYYMKKRGQKNGGK